MTGSGAVVVDSQPLIALLLEEPTADAVEAVLRVGGTQVSTVSIAEVLDVLTRREGLPWDDVELVLGGLLSEALAPIAPDVDAAHGAAGLRAATSTGEAAGSHSPTASWSPPHSPAEASQRATACSSTSRAPRDCGRRRSRSHTDLTPSAVRGG